MYVCVYFLDIKVAAFPFVVRAIVVRGFGGGGEPALVDAAAVESERVQIIGVEFQPFAGLQKGARHPARGESQQSPGRGKGAFHQGFDIAGAGGEIVFGLRCFHDAVGK